MPERILQVNLEPYFAAETELGALVRLKEYREPLANLTGVDVDLMSKLQDYVLGLRYIQGRYVMATKAPNNFEDLVETANQLNDILEADARALALIGIFDREKLGRLQGGNSYKALADDWKHSRVRDHLPADPGQMRHHARGHQGGHADVQPPHPSTG